MIPKIIHYVWVGKNEMPKDIKRCIATWKKHLPDYEFKLWTEDNFDIEGHKFTKQAYEQKKWAYVSDYIRAYAIYENGGIYLDTDVLVLRNLDPLLFNRAFVGFENPSYPFTAVFGAEKGHPFVKDMLEYYEDRDFSFDANNQMKSVNTKTVSDILIQKYDCKVNNKMQVLKDDIKVYPDYILCNPSYNSYTVHVFTGTWMNGVKPLKRKINKELKLRVTTPFRAKWFRRIIMNQRG